MLPRLPREVDELGTTDTTLERPCRDESDDASNEEAVDYSQEPDSGHSHSTPIPISSTAAGKPLLSSKVESLGFSTTDGESTLQSIVSPRAFIPVESLEEGSFVSGKTLKDDSDISSSFDWAGSYLESEPVFSQKDNYNPKRRQPY
eukprot:jgi/Galph1/1018/GphlegSOOS_G5856.1